MEWDWRSGQPLRAMQADRCREVWRRAQPKSFLDLIERFLFLQRPWLASLLCREGPTVFLF